jgi:hypothetical protein
MRLTAGLGALKKRKMSNTCREWNYSFSVVETLAQSLYGMQYISWFDRYVLLVTGVHNAAILRN